MIVCLRRLFALWIGIALLCAVPAAADQPQLRAQLLTLVPALDGDVLNDDAWQSFAPAGDFVQVRPVAGAPATQATAVYVGYSDTALYIGVVCYDDEPAEMIVSDSRRDAPLDDIDSFLVILDVFHDRKNGFVFGTSPTGGRVRRPGYQ